MYCTLIPHVGTKVCVCVCMCVCVCVCVCVCEDQPHTVTKGGLIRCPDWSHHCVR